MHIIILALLALISKISLSMDVKNYHNNNDTKEPGRMVFLMGGSFDAEHPEIRGFSTACKFDHDLFFDGSAETRTSDSSDGEIDDLSAEAIREQIENLKKGIKDTKLKIKFPDHRADDEPEEELREKLGLQRLDLQYWQQKLEPNHSKNDDDGHDTDCAALLSGRTLGAAPLTPIHRRGF